ncbi:MAG: succinate dehydrogenase, cytochrome b556 subunit [Chloroflexi bacterium]|nr:succinate dehydrogenase, cytochrome b556 subunit [Chloroflexota bacterium]MBI3339206.1 succinate dehydrogenase, cytochrome b556 subunit [Chloroflexota bacterium]
MNVKATMTNLVKYRGLEGQWSFILHRLTGLGVLAFLIFHVLDTSTVFFFPSLYADAIGLYRTVPFMIGEIFLVFSVIYHGVNGARIAILDLYLVKNWEIKFQRNSVLWTLVIAIVLWLPAAFVMGRNVLEKLGI